MMILGQCLGSWFSTQVDESGQWVEDELNHELVDWSGQERRDCGTFPSLGHTELLILDVRFWLQCYSIAVDCSLHCLGGFGRMGDLAFLG